VKKAQKVRFEKRFYWAVGGMDKTTKLGGEL